jgi:hypothetical protein
VRHGEEELTPETAVSDLKDYPSIAIKVRDAFVARAPAGDLAGGHAALVRIIDRLIAAWLLTVTDQTAGGDSFSYARARSPGRLLHAPLDTGIDNLSPSHRLFIAGRSMRDVEPSVALKVRDPQGRTIADADDLQ